MTKENLSQLLQSYPEMLNDEKRLIGLLKDMYSSTEETGNVNLMITSINAGIISIFRDNPFDQLLITRAIRILVNNHSISEDRARWVVELWADVLCPGQQKDVGIAPSLQAQANQPYTFFSKIAGVSHYNDNRIGDIAYNRQQIIHELKTKGMLEPGRELTLQPDPQNPYSSNAVKVIGPDSRQLGFLTQTAADSVAPLMRDGHICRAYVSEVTGGTADFLYGVNIRIEIHRICDAIFQPNGIPSKEKINSNWFEIETIDSGLRIKKFVGPNVNKIIIPNQINGAPVIEIGENAFSGCTGLVQVIIQEGILRIEGGYQTKGGWACYDSDGTLADANPPDEIPYGAFAACTNLSNIVIPESVEEIGRGAFADCTKLSEIVLPQSLTKIAAELFRGCTALQRISLPENITGIGFGAFCGCTNLTELTFPPSLTHIESSWFYDCHNLCRIVVPGDIEQIEEGTFEGCSKLSTLSISGDFLRIRDNLFSAHTGLTSITKINLPPHTLEIGENAFAGLTRLSSIEIPKSVTKIGQGAFRGCTGLRSITIPEGIIEIGAHAFQGCPPKAIASIPEKIKRLGWHSFWEFRGPSEITVPDEVTEIEAGLFEDFTNLTHITIPDSVVIIKRNAFRGCAKLQDINFPESIKTIEAGALEDCVSLTNIALPKSLVEVPENLFNGCTALKDVVIPNDVRSIGPRAFRNCTALDSINLPEGIETIGPGAFANCTSLTDITLPQSLTKISASLFYGCTALSNIVIPDSINEIESGAFHNCAAIENTIKQRMKTTSTVRPTSEPVSIDCSEVNVGSKLIHKFWGEGTVTKIGSGYIVVAFGGKEKKFLLPSAFNQGFLSVKE